MSMRNEMSFSIQHHMKRHPFLNMAAADHSWISCQLSLTAEETFYGVCLLCFHLSFLDSENLSCGLRILSRYTRSFLHSRLILPCLYLSAYLANVKRSEPHASFSECVGYLQWIYKINTLLLKWQVFFDVQK